MNEKLLRGMGDLPLAGRINYCKSTLVGWVDYLLTDTTQYVINNAPAYIAHWNAELKQAERELNRRRYQRRRYQRRKEAACTTQSHDDSSRCKTQSTTSV